MKSAKAKDIIRCMLETTEGRAKLITRIMLGELPNYSNIREALVSDDCLTANASDLDAYVTSHFVSRAKYSVSRFGNCDYYWDCGQSGDWHASMKDMLDHYLLSFEKGSEAACVWIDDLCMDDQNRIVRDMAEDNPIKLIMAIMEGELPNHAGIREALKQDMKQITDSELVLDYVSFHRRNDFLSRCFSVYKTADGQYRWRAGPSEGGWEAELTDMLDHYAECHAARNSSAPIVWMDELNESNETVARIF